MTARRFLAVAVGTPPLVLLGLLYIAALALGRAGGWALGPLDRAGDAVVALGNRIAGRRRRREQRGHRWV